MIIRELKSSGSEHITLILEDGQEIPTTLGIVTELRLCAGKPLEEAQLRLFRGKNSFPLTRARAVDLLTPRAHSLQERLDEMLL